MHPSQAHRHTLPAGVVFDCDGVLIESVEIKTRAFVDLFADSPQHHDAITRHHQAHLGISRFEKFRWIHRELLGREPAEDELEELGRRFSELVAEGTRNCPEVLGAAATLRSLAGKGIPLFIASGTPETELGSVIASRGWRKYFDGIHGSPTTKPEILTSISQSLACDPGHLIFVGDGKSDYDAAEHTGAVFVLRETADQADRFSDYAGPRIKDLEGLAEKLSEFSQKR